MASRRSPRLVFRFLVSAAALAVLLVPAMDAFAADAPQPGQRPRIGLVLGGGGAKGAAHIGVIKVLEEMRIPVDCIAGTSMGAIVGAAYATGLSSTELEQVITSVRWKEVLSSAPREDIPMQRKRFDFIFVNGLELGVKDGAVEFPKGIVPTHQVENLFRRIVAGARQTERFTELPIPFKAVATDIESGEMVVMDKGDLTVAMRASMAVPGAFAPVDRDGKLLVDGMLVRNLPVDVARQTCADVVIAVPVSNPALKRADLKDALSVMGQAMNVAIESNEKAQLATLGERDVAVPVILESIGSGDFAKVPDAIPIGEAAARRMAEKLKRYSLSPEAYAAWRSGVGSVAGAPKVRVDEVRLAGLEYTNPAVVSRLIETKPGDSYNPDAATADANRIVATGDFDSVSYQVREENGRNVLTYSAQEKSRGPGYLQFDLNLSTDLDGTTLWGVRVDYSRRWLNALGGEWRVSGQLGSPMVLYTELYQPLDESRTFFVAPRFTASQVDQDIYVNLDRIAQFETSRYSVGMDIGAALGTWGEARAGLEWGGLRSEQEIGTLPFEPGHVSQGAVTASLRYDQQDKAIFPTRGGLGRVEMFSSQTGLGADESYSLVEAGWQSTFTWGRNVLSLNIRGGSDLNTDAPFYDQFRLGGPFSLSGYKINSLTGSEYAFGSVGFRRRFADIDETFGTGVYWGATLEAGNVYERLDRSTGKGLLLGGSVYLAVDSKLGPIYISYGVAENGQSAGYLTIGAPLDGSRP
ncbi:MAG TPA: patatin-like phospholipase family protein [Burkholderiales bacterium]|nr:patatin-like phospholipase family protein [Burkholderiales bacterium]